MLTQKTNDKNEAIRSEIQRQTEEFIAQGNTINLIPNGQSGETPNRGKKRQNITVSKKSPISRQLN